MDKFRMSNEVSPAVFLLAGAAALLSLPPVRRAVLSSARMVMRSVLQMAHDYEHNKNQVKEKTRQVIGRVELPDEFSPEFPDEKLERFGRRIKTHGRKVAVLTAAGALSIVDRTKPFVDEIQNIIREAKMKNNADKAEGQDSEEYKSEFEKELTKKIPIHPGI